MKYNLQVTFVSNTCYLFICILYVNKYNKNDLIEYNEFIPSQNNTSFKNHCSTSILKYSSS